MKTVKIKVYQFDELSEEAKEKAIEHYREQNYDSGYWFLDEANATLKKFCDLFNIDWSRFDYEEMYRSEYSFNMEDQILELEGWRLATYIWNNYRSDIFKGKYYGHLSGKYPDGRRIAKSKAHPIGKRHVKRYSKILLEASCPFTGVCYDDDILRPMYEFLDNPTAYRHDFKQLLDDCLHSLAHSVASEIEHHNSDEGITEEIRANEYEFEEDGSRF